MLNIKKNITLTGESKIDGVVACGFRAVIDSEKPEDMTISSWQVNKNLYKANRAACRADEAEFEDAAYALQDELITANATTVEE